MQLAVPVEAWSARIGALRTQAEIRNWLARPFDPGPRIVAEDLPGVPAMALRRASGLSRAAIAIGLELRARVPVGQALSVVTVSELGELATNDSLIEAVVADEPVSPQRFASSVHNNVLGQLCITLGLPLPGGASTGAGCGLEIGVVEALTELTLGHWVVLLAFEPEVDSHYGPWLGGTAPEHILGVLLCPQAPVRLLLERTGVSRPAPPSPMPGVPHALRWLSLLEGHVDQLAGPDCWHWRHVEG